MPLGGGWSHLETSTKRGGCAVGAASAALSRGAPWQDQLQGAVAAPRLTLHAQTSVLRRRLRGRVARVACNTPHWEGEPSQTLPPYVRFAHGLHMPCFVINKDCCSLASMRYFENQTDGLRHLLKLWSKDAVAWVGFPAEDFKLKAIGEKWAERFGTNLPPHVRHDRRTRNQPNAFAFAHRLAGTTKPQVWLLRTAGDLGPPQSDWSKEAWNTEPPEVGNAETRLYVTKEPRIRGDYAWTWRLGQKHLNLIGSQWRSLAESGQSSELRFAIQSSAKGLPMFGGIRRQLLAEIALQKRRWTHKWPNKPFPAVELPRMGRFAASAPTLPDAS